MSEYNHSEKILNVSPYTGINRKVINNVKTLEWSPGIIVMSDYSKLKRYEVFFAFSNDTNYPLFAKPRKKYEDSLFKELFIFKCECVDFDGKKQLGFLKIHSKLYNNKNKFFFSQR